MINSTDLINIRTLQPFNQNIWSVHIRIKALPIRVSLSRYPYHFFMIMRSRNDPNKQPD